MDNKVLRTAKVVTRVVRVFTIVFAFSGFFTILPATLGMFSADNFYVSEELDSIRWSTDPLEDGVDLSQMPAWLGVAVSIYWLAIGGIYVLILNQVSKVLNSMEAVTTFYEGSIEAFRRITRLFVALFVVTLGALSWRGADAYTLGIEADPIYLIYALVAWVLTEVFREGNRLHEETKYTV
jgi:hypothetical protein